MREWRKNTKLVSYDGICGGKAYGEELPSELRCTKILLSAGLSTQATLLEKTRYIEALYKKPANIEIYIYIDLRWIRCYYI